MSQSFRPFAFGLSRVLDLAHSRFLLAIIVPRKGKLSLDSANNLMPSDLKIGSE
jgi:hypothetical protein